MKKYTLLLSIILMVISARAQKIVSIENSETKYQVLDLTNNDKITWGDYDEIGLLAKSENNGALNTKSIVLAVGNNESYEGKDYAAKVCANSTEGGFDDWYLPAKEEAALIYLNIDKFDWSGNISLWTSTEASGTQAVSLYTYNGTWYNVAKVNSYNMVCLRKVE